MIPVPYTLHYSEPQYGAPDELGNDVTTWSDLEPWQVHGWHQGPSPEAIKMGREPSSVAVTVYAPTAPFTGDARVTVNAEEFEVFGSPADWRNGPWDNPVAGFVVELKRKEG